jgi:hypothetical protein
LRSGRVGAVRGSIDALEPRRCQARVRSEPKIGRLSGDRSRARVSLAELSAKHAQLIVEPIRLPQSA